MTLNRSQKAIVAKTDAMKRKGIKLKGNTTQRLAKIMSELESASVEARSGLRKQRKEKAEKLNQSRDKSHFAEYDFY